MLRQNQKEMLEIRNTVREIKNAFHGFVKRLNTAWGRLREQEDNEMQMEKGIGAGGPQMDHP